ncbi:MAG: hypothetical protein HQL53_11180 [Magnetococcales bacterium]|nr:hypothetical protein [Magnetococcales bacterium]
MPIETQYNIDGVGTVIVNKLTLREIYDLFARQDEDDTPTKPGPDLMLGLLFPDHGGLDDLALFTDISADQAMNLPPDAIDQVMVVVKRENPHFFALLERLGELSGAHKPPPVSAPPPSA